MEEYHNCAFGAEGLSTGIKCTEEEDGHQVFPLWFINDHRSTMFDFSRR